MTNNDQPSGPIIIGFGEAVIRMGGETIYDGEVHASRVTNWKQILTFEHATLIAVHHPGSIVEVAINGPFWGNTWLWRDGEWVVTKENRGFA